MECILLLPEREPVLPGRGNGSQQLCEARTPAHNLKRAVESTMLRARDGSRSARYGFFGDWWQRHDALMEC
jgi:hypothetical protein